MASTFMNHDCLSCKNRFLCRFVEYREKLSQAGQVLMYCKYFASGITQPKINRRDFTDQKMNRTIEELSRAALDLKENNLKTKGAGTCSKCKNYTTRLYECNSCKKLFCGNCGELSTELDINTGESKTIFLCKDCGGDED